MLSHRRNFSFLGAQKHLYNWLCPLLPLFYFFVFFFSLLDCSCPNAAMIFSISAPAHPHGIGVAMYPDLYLIKQVMSITLNKVGSIARAS